MTKMKTCPFCGKRAEVIVRKVGERIERYVRCSVCGAARGMSYEDVENAIEAWNARTVATCATCAHLCQQDGLTFCALVHQTRGNDDFCSRWTERSW